MTPETEGRLLRFLTDIERSKRQNGEQITAAEVDAWAETLGDKGAL